MDGIDAAWVDVSTHTLIAGITRPYSSEAKERLQALADNPYTTPAALNQLNTLIGREFSAAVHQLLLTAPTTPEHIVAIGSHGQTICHDAMAEIPYTVQLGCAHTIAELTGFPVVADFRTRDLVLQGQGAPFAPLYHQALFANHPHPLAVINVGGIANVSFVSLNEPVSGYDIGPGNTLMDLWIQQHHHQPYDAAGAWAASGDIISSLLSELQNDPYFTASHPKSIGKEYFSSDWLNAHLQPTYLPQDVQATLLALTAETIATAIRQHTSFCSQVVICGGGAHNAAFIQTLRHALPDHLVDSTASFGINPDFIEAMMFAWLAEKTIQQEPVDFTSITHAKTQSIYGAVYFSQKKIII